MSKRLRIESGASPFRVAKTGNDASSAIFDNVLFDANQAPLRLYARSYVDVPVVVKSPGGSVVDVTTFSSAFAHTRPPTPSGTNPLFMTMWRCQKLSGDPGGQHTWGPTHFVSPGYAFESTTQSGLAPVQRGSGGGAVMGADGLYGLNFCWNLSGYYGSNRIFFVIFRNYL